MFCDGGDPKKTAKRFFDRQIQAFGEQAQERISRTHVLVQNANSVHAEHLKNLALLGFNILVVDDKCVADSDFEDNVFFDAEDLQNIGQLRGQIVSEKLRRLNPFISVSFGQRIDEDSAEARRCTVFFVSPTSFGQVNELHHLGRKLPGKWFFTFADYSEGFSFIGDSAAFPAEGGDLVPEEASAPLKNRFLEDFKKATSSEVFPYNKAGNFLFVFSGTFGSILTQTLLTLVVEGSLGHNFMAYDFFGNAQSFEDLDYFTSFDILAD